MYNTAYTILWKPQRQPTIGSGGYKLENLNLF